YIILTKYFFFQAEDGIRVFHVTGVQTCALPILAGLESIPRLYYEAAQIDGASRWVTFRYITLPLLNPTIVVSLVMATAAPSIGMLQLFTHVMNLKFNDPGGPLGSTLTVVLYTYQRAFQA